MRLFFAVELPDEVRDALGGLRAADEENRDYRWSDPALLHVTLAFLGEQAVEKLPVLERIGADAARASHGGTLRLGQAGQFGGMRTPRVLWVDIAGDVEALLGLQHHLAQLLAQQAFPVEEREFRAHVTLARRREAARGGPPRGWPPSLEPTSFPFDHLTLMHSRLSPRGPAYTPIYQFPLAG